MFGNTVDNAGNIVYNEQHDTKTRSACHTVGGAAHRRTHLRSRLGGTARGEAVNVTRVRELESSKSGARRVLWRCEPPFQCVGWDGELEPAEPTEYVITSAVNAMFSGAETYIFAADAEGNVTDWGELPGSYRGGYDHEKAIAGLVASAT